MPAALRGTTNAADKRTTSGAAAKPRSAGAACRRTPDPAGAGGLFCAGPGLRHLCTVAGAAGVDAHAHGHGGVRRLAGIRTGQPSAGSILAAVGLSDGAHDPGAASVLRPGHAGALQGLRSAQLLHDLCHERRDLFHHLLGRAAGRVDKGWFMFFITLLDQFYWVASAGLGLRWAPSCPSAPKAWIL